MKKAIASIFCAASFGLVGCSASDPAEEARFKACMSQEMASVPAGSVSGEIDATKKCDRDAYHDVKTLPSGQSPLAPVAPQAAPVSTSELDRVAALCAKGNVTESGLDITKLCERNATLLKALNPKGPK